MPRRKVILSSDYPYFITGRCLNRDWFRLPTEEVWSIFEDRLYFCTKLFNLRIHAFVLMDNHFHLLLSTPDANISCAMEYLLGMVSREITKRSGRINQTFGTRHHKTLIRNHHNFQNAYKYLFRNPVAAGMSDNVEDYPFSTLHGLLGRRLLLIPVVDDTILFPDIGCTLKWLNTKPKDKHVVDIKNALGKAEFSLPIDRVTRKKNELELELF